MSAAESVLAALDDPEALERAMGALPTAGALLPILLDAAPSGAMLSALPSGQFEVADARRLGRAGLWLATGLVRAHLPRIRVVPSPMHERWDALVELERQRPEAPWLVGVLVAHMTVGQERLAARTLLGVERRFGVAGWRAIALAVEGTPMEELVRRSAPSRA